MGKSGGQEVDLCTEQLLNLPAQKGTPVGSTQGSGGKPSVLEGPGGQQPPAAGAPLLWFFGFGSFRPELPWPANAWMDFLLPFFFFFDRNI